MIATLFGFLSQHAYFIKSSAHPSSPTTWQSCVPVVMCRQRVACWISFRNLSALFDYATEWLGTDPEGSFAAAPGITTKHHEYASGDAEGGLHERIRFALPRPHVPRRSAESRRSPDTVPALSPESACTSRTALPTCRAVPSEPRNGDAATPRPTGKKSRRDVIAGKMPRTGLHFGQFRHAAKKIPQRIPRIELHCGMRMRTCVGIKQGLVLA